MTDATLGKNNKPLAYLKVHTTNQMEMRQKQVDIQDCSLDTAEKAMAPTPALLPGQSHGRRSPVGCGPWGRCESNMTEQLHFHALEKEMAAHSSVLAWRIPGMGEPGGLPSVGSQKVGHD